MWEVTLSSSKKKKRAYYSPKYTETSTATLLQYFSVSKLPDIVALITNPDTFNIKHNQKDPKSSQEKENNPLLAYPGNAVPD